MTSCVVSKRERGEGLTLPYRTYTVTWCDVSRREWGRMSGVASWPGRELWRNSGWGRAADRPGRGFAS